MAEGRLTGVRLPYTQLPATVRRFVEAELGGPVARVTPRVGGMSPAVAASVESAAGRRAFVKAVGADVHPDTPDHFRHERAILEVLPAVPYRAGLLAAYDDGGWVALLLQDVDGHHPDWDSGTERDAVLATVRRQSEELTPPAPSLPAVSSREGMQKYQDKIKTATEPELAALPAWVRAELDPLTALLGGAISRHRDESFCHWDIRHDNILVRQGDGQPVLLDWGMARRGQRWGDIMCVALEWVETAAFDRIVATHDLSAEEEADVTGFLVGLGLFSLMLSSHPPHPHLPHLPAFRRQLGHRTLTGVHRRLALGLG